MTKAEVCDHPGFFAMPTYLDYGADPLTVSHTAAGSAGVP